MAARNDGIKTILEKLRHHAEYAQRSEEELRELAYNLTDFDCMFRRFHHLLGPVVDKAIDEALIDYRAVFTHSQEIEMAHRRAKHELARVFHLPVKLFLSRLRQTIPMYSITGKVSNFFLEYGALHAGLVVGNIRIEWGQESIVEAQPEDDIPGDDFVATVQSKGELGQGAVETCKKFSLANRERRTDEKIKLIINTAEKKKEVLSNLVQVVTSYNLERKYDLFSCNCQHFVRDALAALGINEPPRFTGQLRDYLEHLKQGKIEVPEDFQNHATLDAYVEQQLQAAPGMLNQHDMEYLLLHYYRLHLNSMPEDDDIDKWECDVPTCKCERLADRVDRESLLNNQFPPRISSASPYASPIPPIAENSAVQPPRNGHVGVAGSTESREEELRRKEEERRRQIDNDKERAKEMANGVRQDEAFERYKDRGYHARVAAKLRNLSKEYAEASAEVIERAVSDMTECELFRTKYDCFSGVIEQTSKGYTYEAMADLARIEAEQLQHDTAKSKVRERYDSLSRLPVRLMLRIKQADQPPARIFDAQLDAVLLVFDHIIEWNANSLVIPQRIDLNKFPPTLMTPVLHGSEWSMYASSQRSKMKSMVKTRSNKLHKKEIDLVFKLTTKKDGVISAIVKTAVDYNRHKHFDERDCNNHHFIQDVTAAMGIKRLPKIGESLGKQLEQSRQLCMETLPRTEFADHAELDEFIRDSNTLPQLNIRDMEYLIGKYFHFHVRHWERLNCPNQWTCEEDDCQLKKLEEQLEKLSLSSDRKCSIM